MSFLINVVFPAPRNPEKMSISVICLYSSKVFLLSLCFMHSQYQLLIMPAGYFNMIATCLQVPAFSPLFLKFLLALSPAKFCLAALLQVLSTGLSITKLKSGIQSNHQ